MKRLILVRHGKSSWKHDVQDAKRPLKKRAYRDADKVIEAFKPFFIQPAVLWSSPAVRALESAKIFGQQLNIPEADFLVKKELYTFDDRSLLKVINSCDDSIGQLIVFGHNPAITELVNSLGNEIFDNVPTTGLTAIEFKTDSWKKLPQGITLFNFFPKHL